MNKRILSILLVLTMVLGSATVALAAPYDLVHRMDSAKTYSMIRFAKEPAVFKNVVGEIENYLIKAEDGKLYVAEEVNEALEAGAENFEEAVKDLEPVEIEEPSEDLEVVEVSAINSTAIKVVFNKAVTKGTGFYSAENLANYYIGIGDEDVASSSIAANNTTDYKAELQEDGKTVIISAATDPANVIWADKYTEETETFDTNASALVINSGGDEVVKNKEVTVQVRNVKDLAGNLMSTDEATFKSVDTTPATIFGGTTKFDTTSTLVDIVANEDNVTKAIVTSDDDIYFVFDEPMYDNGDVEYYLDSKNITSKVEVVAYDDSNAELYQLKALKIDGDEIKDLTLGKHEFEIVGLQDLAGNKPLGDVYTGTIEVVEPKDVDPDEEAPVVKGIEQIEEGKFEISFAVAPKNDTKIKLKDTEGNTVHEEVYSYNNGVVEFATKKADYKKGTKISYTVEVTGDDGGKIEPASGSLKADKYSERHTFKLDLEAPTVVYSKTDAEGKVTDTKWVTDKAKITVPFEDNPFDGGILLQDESGYDKKIILKLHKENGETKSLEIPFAEIATNASKPLDFNSDYELVIDVAKLVTSATNQNVKDAAAELLNDANDEFLKGDYELILPRGLVRDAKNEETNTKRLTDTASIDFVGDTITFTVTEGQVDTGASVPQTAQDLVTYNEDHDAIIVKFVGEDIDPATAKKPANYTLAGKKLASDTYVEYEILEDADGSGTKGAEVRLYLNKDTIKRDGNYTLKVSNVATSKGAKMIPVSVTVTGMKDNTRPVLESAVVTGDKKIELRFSESVKIEDAAKAANNFTVTVNGSRYTVKEVTFKDGTTDSSRNVYLELNDSIDYVGTVILVIADKDGNADYFVRDIAGNELKPERVEATVELE